MRPFSAGIAAWAVLIGSFLAFSFFGWQTFTTRLETGESFPQYSTYRADPKGLKALYESLRATDLLNVSRRLQFSKTLPSGAHQVLFIAGVRADQQSISEEDTRFLDNWLATGGRLIIALRPDENQTAHRQSAPRANQEGSEETPSILWQTQLRRWGIRIVPLSDIPSSTAHSPVFGTISRWLGRNSFDRLTADWKVIAFQGNKEVIVERPFDALSLAHGKPTDALSLDHGVPFDALPLTPGRPADHGGGSLVLMADSYPLSNEALAADRNTGFLLWLIDDRRNILFDETHLGLSEQPGIMALAQRYGLQGALISLVAVLLLFIWKCQYTLVPRTKLDQKDSIVAAAVLS